MKNPRSVQRARLAALVLTRTSRRGRAHARALASQVASGVRALHCATRVRARSLRLGPGAFAKRTGGRPDINSDQRTLFMHLLDVRLPRPAANAAACAIEARPSGRHSHAQPPRARCRGKARESADLVPTSQWLCPLRPPPWHAHSGGHGRRGPAPEKPAQVAAGQGEPPMPPTPPLVPLLRRPVGCPLLHAASARSFSSTGAPARWPVTKSRSSARPPPPPPTRAYPQGANKKN